MFGKNNDQVRNLIRVSGWLNTSIPNKLIIRLPNKVADDGVALRVAAAYQVRSRAPRGPGHRTMTTCLD